jgi:hypothetical protein
LHCILYVLNPIIKFTVIAKIFGSRHHVDRVLCGNADAYKKFSDVGKCPLPLSHVSLWILVRNLKLLLTKNELLIVGGAKIDNILTHIHIFPKTEVANSAAVSPDVYYKTFSLHKVAYNFYILYKSHRQNVQLVFSQYRSDEVHSNRTSLDDFFNLYIADINKKQLRKDKTDFDLKNFVEFYDSRTNATREKISITQLQGKTQNLSKDKILFFYNRCS